MSENLATILTDTTEQHGDRIALKLDDTELSYEFLDGATKHLAGLLKSKGFEPGDRVGIMLPNVPYFAVIYYGVLRAGGTVVPMNPLLKGREVEFYLSDPGAKIFFAWHDFAEAAEKGADEAGAELILVKPGEFEELVGEAEPEDDMADVSADDTAVILYTSRHHRQAQGRRAHPLEPQEEHRDLARDVQPGRRGTSRWARCPCSTPSGRRAGSTPPSPAAGCSP